MSLTNTGPTLGEYLALVTFDTATLIAADEMRADGGDLRVSDATCNSYDFWLESGLETADTRVWVKVPAVPAGESRFFVHHGDFSLTRENRASDVFGENVSALYTFTEGAGTVVHDWVGQYDLRLYGTAAWTPGPRTDVGGINGFRDMNGSVTGWLFSDSNGPQFGYGDFSAFVMVNSTNWGGPLIGNWDYNSFYTGGWRLTGSTGGQISLEINQGDIPEPLPFPRPQFECRFSGGNVPPGTWSMLGGRRWAAAINSLFHNGANIASGCPGDERRINGAAPFQIGGSDGFTSPSLDGVASMAILYARALTDQDASDLYTSLFPASPPVMAITATPPGSPTITAATATTTTITLAFTPGPDGGSPVTTYTANCSKGGVFTQSGPSSPLTVTGLLPDISYTCDVFASNLIGAGPPSAAVTIVTQPPPVPQPPTNVAVGVNGALVTLTFEPAASGTPAEWFQIEIGTVSGLTNLLTYVTRQPGFIGLLPDGTFFLRVRSVNFAAGLSAPSAEVPIQVSSGQPVSGPVAAVGAAVDGNAVTLSWQRSTIGADARGYRLEVGQSYGVTDLGTLDLPSATTTFTVRGVPSGVYSVRVRSLSSVGPSPPSQDVMFIVGEPAGCVSAPRPPVMLTPIVIGQTVALSWLPQDDFAATAGNRLYVGSTPGASDFGVFNTPSPTSSIVGQAGNGRYYLRLSPFNACGETRSLVEQVIAVGSFIPEAPSGLTAQVTGNAVTLNWTPPPGAIAGYVLDVGLSPDATDISLPTGSTAPTFAIGKVPSGTYYVRVRARNAAGIGAASNTVMVVVP